MADAADFTPVSDNTLLAFGNRMIARGDYNISAPLDISAVFEDGFLFGTRTVDAIRVSTDGLVRVGAEDADPWAHPLYINNVIAPLFTDLITERNPLPEGAGVFFDMNTERDSVVVTWNKVEYWYNWDNPGAAATFQLEILDLGDGDAEIVFRYGEMDEPGDYGSSFTFGASSDTGPRLGVDSNTYDGLDLPITEMPTLEGNTGIAGVWQFRVIDGILQADDLLGADETGTGDGDIMTGTIFPDRLDGAGGDDLIAGLEGNDALTGAAGNDTLEGGSGADTLNGGDGDDELLTGPGRNSAFGGEGDDLIVGGGEDGEYYYYGSGDLLEGMQGNDTVRGGWGDDTIGGHDGADVLHGGGGWDLLGGGAGDDLVSGGDNWDTLFGGDGNDALAGGYGWDRLYGGDGDDFLFGGEGRDTATGGAGADRFFASYIRSDRLHITDYNADEGDVLIYDGDFAERGDFSIRRTILTDADGNDTFENFEIVHHPRPDDSRVIFTFENAADIDEIMLRLPRTMDASETLVFDLMV